MDNPTGSATVPASATDSPAHGISFSEAVRVWARVAALSFGGPAGQIAVMHRIIVEEKRWIGETRFLHALNFCTLLPGPEAQQLAIYIGWLLHKTKGGLVAGILFVLPGVVAIEGAASLQTFCEGFDGNDAINAFPLIVLVDDAEFTARTLNNFLWVTFTRSNPAADIGGIGAFIEQKHWGCRGALVIDARRKPHHAPPLVEDPEVTKRVDALAAPGKPLHGVI